MLGILAVARTLVIGQYIPLQLQPHGDSPGSCLPSPQTAIDLAGHRVGNPRTLGSPESLNLHWLGAWLTAANPSDMAKFCATDRGDLYIVLNGAYCFSRTGMDCRLGYHESNRSQRHGQTSKRFTPVPGGPPALVENAGIHDCERFEAAFLVREKRTTGRSVSRDMPDRGPAYFGAGLGGETRSLTARISRPQPLMRTHRC